MFKLNIKHFKNVFLTHFLRRRQRNWGKKENTLSIITESYLKPKLLL